MHRSPTGASLTELTAVVAILGVIAAMALPRALDAIDAGDAAACHCNRAEIELQARLWRRVTDSWPSADLSDIAADTDYFPEGTPTCPVDGSGYLIDGSTGLVIGHDH